MRTQLGSTTHRTASGSTIDCSRRLTPALRNERGSHPLSGVLGVFCEKGAIDWTVVDPASAVMVTSAANPVYAPARSVWVNICKEGFSTGDADHCVLHPTLLRNIEEVKIYCRFNLRQRRHEAYVRRPTGSFDAAARSARKVFGRLSLPSSFWSQRSWGNHVCTPNLG